MNDAMTNGQNSVIGHFLVIKYLDIDWSFVVPRCFRWNGNAARVVWILDSTPPVAMCGRGGSDVEVLQAQQKSQIVAPLLHTKSLIINVCSTVAGGGRIPVNSAVGYDLLLRQAAPIWAKEGL
jgi:hypothetical protein